MAEQWKAGLRPSFQYQGEVIPADPASNDDFVIAYTYGPNRLENAHLIAAAPEMLEVLRELEDLCPRMSDDDPIAPAIADAIRRARQAIQKAEGLESREVA